MPEIPNAIYSDVKRVTYLFAIIIILAIVVTLLLDVKETRDLRIAITNQQNMLKNQQEGLRILRELQKCDLGQSTLNQGEGSGKASRKPTQEQ